MTAQSEVFFAHLGRFRRRAAGVIFARALLTTGSMAVVIAAAAVLLHALAPATAFACTTAAAVIVAVSSTIARVPSPAATAIAVDRSLQFDDRIVSAVHCARQTDPFAQLVVRDAIARLAGVDAAAAFPLRVPRAAVAAPVAMSIAILVGAGLPAARRWLVAGSALAPAIAGGPARVTTAADRDRGLREAAMLASNQRPTAEDRRSAAARPTLSNTADRAIHQPANGADTSGQSGGDPQADAAGARTPTNDATRSGIRGASAAGTAVGAPSTLAGGVTGGTENRGPRRATASAARAEYASAYRAARSAAETSMAQDRIPAERRAYVRAYFDAIKPQGGQ